MKIFITILLVLLAFTSCEGRYDCVDNYPGAIVKKSYIISEELGEKYAVHYIIIQLKSTTIDEKLEMKKLRLVKYDYDRYNTGDTIR